MNLNGLCRLLFVVFATLVVSTAHAQIYSCKTPGGRTITSDRPIPECAKLPMRELRKDGAVKRTIAPPLTRSQREAAARQRLLDRAESMRRRQEQARDRALVTAYPTMDDLEHMRARQIGEVQTQIDGTYARMVQLHKRLRAAQASSRAYPPGKAPGRVKQKIAQIASAILSEDALVKAHLNEQEQIRNRFNDDAARLQILLDRMAEADRLAGG